MTLSVLDIRAGLPPNTRRHEAWTPGLAWKRLISTAVPRGLAGSAVVDTPVLAIGWPCNTVLPTKSLFGVTVNGLPTCEMLPLHAGSQRRPNSSGAPVHCDR
jgi:hypothetical protein